MKHFAKLIRLFATLIFCVAAQFTFSQGLKDFFTDNGLPMVYLGIDFSKARLIGGGNSEDIHNRLYKSINQVIVDEPKRYKIEKAFHRDSITHDFSAVFAQNDKVNASEIISSHSSDFNRFKETDIDAMVSALDLSGKQGIGLLFIMEAMRKLHNSDDAAIWVTLIDMGTKKVLMTERMVMYASTAIGFRNYWASTIKNLIDIIHSTKYKEWKKKYRS